MQLSLSITGCRPVCPKRPSMQLLLVLGLARHLIEGVLLL